MAERASRASDRSDEDSEANVQDATTKSVLARSEISGQDRQAVDCSSGEGFDLLPYYETGFHPFNPVTHLSRQGPVEMIFDMKKGTPEITAGTLGRLHGISEDLIFEVPIKSKSTKVFVIAAKQTDRYLLVQGEYTTRCIRLQPETTQQQIVQTAFPENHGNMLDDVLCFFVKECRFDQLDLLHMHENYEPVTTVKVVKSKAIRFAFVYRCDVFYEKTFIVKGNNTDCLNELKLKFLALFYEKENSNININIDCVWFILNNKVLSEQMLHSALSTSFSRKLLLRAQRLSPINTNLTIYVHFQPPNAIPIKIQLRSDGKPNKIEKLTVVSHQISESLLRLEVARVTEAKPEALEIFVSKKKLDAKLNTQQVLHNNCIVSVEIKQEITIDVEILHLTEPLGEVTGVSVRMYPYDCISKLKSEVCTRCSAIKENVDICFGDKYLTDEMTVNECRLRDTDVVKAHVFFKRVCIRVRSTSRRLHDVVDDAGKTTVGDLNIFMQKNDRTTPVQHPFSTAAIFNGRVLQEDDTLINTGLCSKASVLVFIQTNTTCFTSSSALKGKLIVYCDSGQGWFHPTLTMSDGKGLYYAPEVSQTTEKILSLVEERNHTPPILHGSVEGIRVLSHRQTTHSKHVKRYQPQNSGRTDLPPSIQCSRRRRQVSNAFVPKIIGFPGESPGDGNNKTVDWFLGDSQNESVRFSEQESIADSPTSQTNYMPLTSKDARNTRVTQRRSTMFPLKSFSETLNNFQDMTSNSDGEECEISRRGKCFHKTFSFQSFQKHPDGMLTIHQMSESETSLPSEAAQDQLFFGKKWTLDSPIEGTRNISSALLQHLPSINNIVDSSFRYINRRIVNEVAKQIGLDGPELCRNLGVLERKIVEAREAHPGKLAEQNYSMLTSWCHSAGEKATTETLKTGLRECQRNDVIAIIDDLQMEPLTC